MAQETTDEPLVCYCPFPRTQCPNCLFFCYACGEKRTDVFKAPAPMSNDTRALEVAACVCPLCGQRAECRSAAGLAVTKGALERIRDTEDPAEDCNCHVIATRALSALRSGVAPGEVVAPAGKTPVTTDDMVAAQALYSNVDSASPAGMVNVARIAQAFADRRAATAAQRRPAREAIYVARDFLFPRLATVLSHDGIEAISADLAKLIEADRRGTP